MSKTARCCRECSTPLQKAAKPEARFCSNPCKDRWNNRRKNRGAELYDLFMAYRYDRGVSKALGLWSLICRMGSVWNEEDKETGRQSYGDPRETKERMIRYLGTRHRA